MSYRKDDAESIGMKQSPRETGYDTSSQPESKAVPGYIWNPTQKSRRQAENAKHVIIKRQLGWTGEKGIYATFHIFCLVKERHVLT